MFLIILWCWWNPTWAQIICQTCFDCFLFCVGSSNAPDSPVSAPKMSQTLQTWFLLILSCIFVEIHKTLKYFRFNILRPQLLFWMDFLFLVAIWDQSDLTGLKTKHYLWKVCPQVWTMGSFYCTKQWRLQSIKHFIEQSEVLKTWNSMPCDYTGSQGFHTNVSLNHSLQNETFMDATDRKKKKSLFQDCAVQASTHAYCWTYVHKTSSNPPCFHRGPLSFYIPVFHHGWPFPKPSSHREQLGPRRTQHWAWDHGDSRKSHRHAVLCICWMWKVPGVCACSERLL